HRAGPWSLGLTSGRTWTRQRRSARRLHLAGAQERSRNATATAGESSTAISRPSHCVPERVAATDRLEALASLRPVGTALASPAMPTNRMEAFSDGVIAILITVMVLELHVPHGTTWGALRD